VNINATDRKKEPKKRGLSREKDQSRWSKMEMRKRAEKRKDGRREGGREGGSNRPGFDNNNLTTTIHHLIDEE